jgi:hypothetical protein
VEGRKALRALVPMFSLAAGALTVAAVAMGRPTPKCGALDNLYTASLAQLHACNLIEVPLSSVTALLGGGKSYNYNQPDGQVYSVLQTPVGFNPVTASRAEDAAYGVPPAPRLDTPGYARWLQIVSAPSAPAPERAYIVERERS